MKKFALGKVHDAIVTNETPKLLEVILVEEGEPDLSTSINAYLLSEGLATMKADVFDDDQLPEEVMEWKKFEDEAQENQAGLWIDGVAAVSDGSDNDGY